MATIGVAGARAAVLRSRRASDPVEHAIREVREIYTAGFLLCLCISNRPNQEILVPDWLITSHVT